MASGILVIDKPAGWTSMDVCAKLRGVFHEKRVGHSGTLDPMATGVLPVFVGRATRAVEFAEKSDKEYIAGLKLGVITNTQDTTGEVLETRPVQISREQLEAALEKFRGDIMQVPPMYSAIKINGKKLYELTVNGVKIGEFTEDTSVSTIMNQINGNKDAGVNVSYSKATNEFTFTAKETGMAGRIEFGDGLGKALFGDTSAADAKFEKGQDAIFNASINGVSMELTRSSNTVDMDGMSVTLKGEFGYKEGADGKLELDPSAEAVTFSSSADADKIVDAIKSMVNDYNEMVKEIKEAYSTLPMQKSTGQYYEPLTDEDMEDMSETAIENWNNKAKAGILFGDQDLRSLYQRMTQAISMTGADGADLKAAGITVNYANGLTTLAFDENKLRSTLETDPDRVTDIFTKSTDSGSSTKGFLQALKEPLDLYGKTEGVNLSTGTKGVLVNKAGHPLAASTMYNNNMQKQLDKIDKEIERWQDKMSDRVDYYTNKFSQLEQLIAQMNSQSSTLAGLMGNMG